MRAHASSVAVWLTAAACAVGTGVSAANAQTNGFVLQCFSARAAAQGCVTRGQDGTPAMLFRDPAGILQFGRPALEVGLAPFAPALTFDNASNSGAEGSRHVYPLAGGAYVGPRLGRVAWAVGVEPIGGFGADFKLQHPILSGTSGTAVDYESFFAALKAGPVAAIELAPGLGLGASVSAVYARIEEFRMPFSMPPAAAAGLGPLAGLDPAYGPLFGQFTELTAYGDSEGYTGWGWSADVGVRYSPSPLFTVAASWSSKSTIEVDGGTAVIDMTAQFEQMMGALVAVRMEAYSETQAVAQQTVASQLSAAGLDLAAGVSATYDAATEITLPMTFGAGFSFRPGPWTATAEVEWRQWSEAESVMPFKLTAGDNANLNLMINADPTDGAFTYPFPLHWKDTYTGKVGLGYALGGGHAVRAGYLYGENPVPDNTVFVTFPAIVTQAVSVGGTIDLGRLPLDVSLVHAFDKRLDGCDDGHMVASEYVGSRTTLNETVLTLGTVIRF